MECNNNFRNFCENCCLDCDRRGSVAHSWQKSLLVPGRKILLPVVSRLNWWPCFVVCPKTGESEKACVVGWRDRDIKISDHYNFPEGIRSWCPCKLWPNCFIYFWRSSASYAWTQEAYTKTRETKREQSIFFSSGGSFVAVAAQHELLQQNNFLGRAEKLWGQCWEKNKRHVWTTHGEETGCVRWWHEHASGPKINDLLSLHLVLCKNATVQVRVSFANTSVGWWVWDTTAHCVAQVSPGERWMLRQGKRPQLEIHERYGLGCCHGEARYAQSL